MRILTRAVTALCVVLVSATCTDHPAPNPTEPEIEPQFAKRDESLPGGTLRLCKVAGSGIETGVEYTFAVTQSGVMRSASIATGSCIELTVPREGASLSKGYFQRKTDDVEDLVPSGTSLRVDGALLTSVALVAILKDEGGVQASSSLLLNLAQQLIAAKLNILRGVQASTEVLQAVANTNAAIQVDPGPPIAIASGLGAAELSALVDVLTAFNEGKPRPAAPGPTASFAISEAILPMTEIESIECTPASACSDADLAAGSVTALVTSGQITTVEYLNRSLIGRIRVCKSAGQGLQDGLSFDFTATGIDVSDGGTVTVSTGDCDEMILEEGRYLVTETLVPGTKVSGLSCAPGPLCSDVDLDSRSVEAGVVGGTITHVSYTNSTTLGTLRVCKSAGPGVEPGTNFDFTALNTSGKVVPVNLTVPADDCGEVTLEEGDYELSEQAMPLVKLSGMSCGPGHLCGQLDLANRTMMLTILGNQITIASFTNRSTLGTLRVCKTAGPGIEPGTSFDFTALETSGKAVPIVFAVAADDCSDIALEEGGYELFENAVDEVRVSGIGCTPSHLCGDIDLPTSSLELTIVDNQTTTASFTNRSTRGTLRICKVAGTGISAGTMYGFTATKPDHTLSLDVPADDCREALVPAGEYALAETVPPDARVTDISCTPLLACFNANVLEGTTTVHVARELLTAVSFTNRSTRGTLRICKVAGPGVTAGTIYKFSAIKSDHALFIDVPADDCSEASIPAGEYAFSEIIPAGVQVADIGCTPLLACFNVSVPDGTATVHVATDLLTTVTVTNQAVVSGGPDDRP